MGRSPMSALTHWLKKELIEVLPAVLYFFVDVYRGRPLIYNTLWKTGFYAIMSLLFRLGELTFDTLFEYKSLLVAKEFILNAISEPRFRAIQFWLIILLLIFVTSKELIGAIEPVRIRQLFVGR